MNDALGLTYLTHDLPGTGGHIKERVEDFIVEEVPLYQFSDSGGFSFLLLEKTDLSSLELVKVIRECLDLKDHEVGLAGWKDKRAVTRQWISLPFEKTSADRLAPMADRGIRILQKRRHSNKLRTGHLLGNRFSVLIRKPDPQAKDRALSVIQRLQKQGLPNFYGAQRFGARGDNPQKGLALLQGKYRLSSVRQRKLLISACSSLIFNLTLKNRMERDLFARLLPGDIAKKHDTGGLFLVGDAVEEQPRADRLEISATGPIWGKKMRRAQDEAGGLEERILTSQGLTPEVFHKQPGSRRPLRVVPRELTMQPESEGLRLEFFLPKGSYATVLLDEIMKTSPDFP